MAIISQHPFLLVKQLRSKPNQISTRCSIVLNKVHTGSIFKIQQGTGTCTPCNRWKKVQDYQWLWCADCKVEWTLFIFPNPTTQRKIIQEFSYNGTFQSLGFFASFSCADAVHFSRKGKTLRSSNTGLFSAFLHVWWIVSAGNSFLACCMNIRTLQLHWITVFVPSYLKGRNVGSQCKEYIKRIPGFSQIHVVMKQFCLSGFGKNSVWSHSEFRRGCQIWETILLWFQVYLHSETCKHFS